MSRYYLPLLTGTLFLFISGCAPTAKEGLQSVEEDAYILIAYDALHKKEYATSQEYFDRLYTTTSNPLYLQEILGILISQKEFDLAIGRSTAYLLKEDDNNIRKLLIEALKEKKLYPEAIVEAEKLVQKEPDEISYIIAAELYFLNKEYKHSIENYKKAYDINPSDYVVDKIAEILYIYLKEGDEAIKYYETHIRFHGCGKYLCQRMAALYARKGDIDGVISAYSRMYEVEPDEITGRKIIDLYLLKNDYKGLQAFLELSRLDDMMLLKLLKYNREYKKAAEVALRIFQANGEIDYLAQHVMFTYESGNQKDKALIKKTIEGLRDVIKQNNSHVYLNYLGYLLIDNNIDIKEGMELVNQALEQDKENVSYLDSLAWGYYKQKKYEAAYAIMKKLKKTLEDPILKEHYDAIKKKYELTTKKRK